MKKEKKVAIAHELINYRQRTGTSQETAGKQIGISKAYVNYVEKGLEDENKWNGIADDKWQQVERYIMPTREWRINTTVNNFVFINNLCADAQHRSITRPVIAKSGYGKSTALRNYKLNHSNVFYIEISELMSVHDLLDAMLSELGLMKSGNAYKKLKAITDKLNSLDHPLLILDEFGKLNEKKQLIVHDIYNATYRNCGIVVAGVDYTYDNLLKAVKRDHKGMPELFRRLGKYWEVLDSATNLDIKTIIETNVPERKITKDAIRWIQSHSDSYSDVYQFVSDAIFYVSNQKNDVITAEILNDLFS